MAAGHQRLDRAAHHFGLAAQCALDVGAQAPGMGGGLAHREPGKGVDRARALLGARGIHAAFFGDLRSPHEVRNGPIARRAAGSFEA